MLLPHWLRCSQLLAACRLAVALTRSADHLYCVALNKLTFADV
jgi:hypothetical protein